MTLLEARGLTKFYGPFCALDKVSLAVRRGEFVSIIGPNGAGKSTLINLLTGVSKPTAGTVSFKDRDVTGFGPVRLAKLGMARSFQLVQIFPDLTVLETLQAAAVSRLGRGRSLFASLADVASAFALRPEVILLDEPTSGVSTADKTAIMETLVSAAKRIGLQAIIQVEHDMDIVFGYSDRIVALHQGHVLADASPAEIQADDEVIDAVIGRRAAAR